MASELTASERLGIAPVYNTNEYYTTMDVEDLDYVHDTLPYTPIYLNDIESNTVEDRARLSELIMTQYHGQDSLSSAPSCRCPDSPMYYATDVNRVCPVCNTRIEMKGKETIQADVWFRAPEGVKKLVSPIAWEHLRNNLKAGPVCLLTYLCDPTYEVNLGVGGIKMPAAGLKRWQQFKRLDLERGFNSLYDNFDAVLEFAASKDRGQRHNDFMKFFEIHRDKIFCDHLPIPHRIGFVVEETSTGAMADTIITEAINAARTIPLLKSTATQRHSVSRKLTTIMNSLVDYLNKSCGKPVTSKKGWYRQNAMGTKTVNSIHSVIVAESGVHNYAQVTMPYPQVVVALRGLILNVLINKYKMSKKQANNYILAHNIEEDAFLKKVIEDDILGRSNGGLGVPMTWTRYPTLHFLSIQCFFLRFIGPVATLSVLCTKGPNADFDGDKMSGQIATTKEQEKIMLRQQPHFGIHSFKVPFTLNGAVSLPDLTGALIHSVLEREAHPEFF